MFVRGVGEPYADGFVMASIRFSEDEFFSLAFTSNNRYSESMDNDQVTLQVRLDEVGKAISAALGLPQ